MRISNIKHLLFADGQVRILSMYLYVLVCTPYVQVHTLAYYLLMQSNGRCYVAELIWIHAAWMVQKLLSTVFALRCRAQHAGVLTVSWPMDIEESANTAGWQR